MEANATFTLDSEARRKLDAVYRYLLDLNRRKQRKAADGDDPGGDTSTAADPSEEPEQGII